MKIRTLTRDFELDVNFDDPPSQYIFLYINIEKYNSEILRRPQNFSNYLISTYLITLKIKIMWPSQNI